MYLSFLSLLHAVSDDVGATANAELTGIEHKIIVVGVGPPPSRILEVVVAASPVHLFNTLCGSGGIEIVFVHHPLHGIVLVRRHEDTEGFGITTQHLVGTTPDDHAGLLHSQRADHAALAHEDGIVMRGIHRHRDTLVGEDEFP